MIIRHTFWASKSAEGIKAEIERRIANGEQAEEALLNSAFIDWLPTVKDAPCPYSYIETYYYLRDLMADKVPWEDTSVAEILFTVWQLKIKAEGLTANIPIPTDATLEYLAGLRSRHAPFFWQGKRLILNEEGHRGIERILEIHDYLEQIKTGDGDSV